MAHTSGDSAKRERGERVDDDTTLPLERILAGHLVLEKPADKFYLLGIWLRNCVRKRSEERKEVERSPALVMRRCKQHPDKY
jgi:hypothetical protein